MDDDKPPASVFLNGMDLSEFVQAVDIQTDPEASIDLSALGLRKTESVTISGRWALFALCSACGEEFSPGSDTPFSMIIEDAFERRWPICNACAMAFLKTDE